MQFVRDIFTLSPVAYITVDYKKLVSDLFYASSTLVESESIKRNITIGSKLFYIQYRSTLQWISPILHCIYPAKSLWDLCKLVFAEV